MTFDVRAEAEQTRLIMTWCQNARKVVADFELDQPDMAILIYEGLEFIEADPRGDVGQIAMHSVILLLEAASTELP